MNVYLLCVTLQCWVLQVVHSLNESSRCPVWMVACESNQSSCFYSDTISCNTTSLTLIEPNCVSYDSYFQQLVTGLCPYSYFQSQYVKHLNSSVTYDEFNEVVCGPLKRRGRLCSRCIPGCGIPVFSKATDECVSCDSKYSWPLYLALVLLPITLFYFLVIIFNFSANHPPITAYTFYCQLFVQIMYNIRFVRHYFINASKHLQNLTWTTISVWNLDILQYIMPSFCLEENFTSMDAILMELLAALYPVFLVIFTFFLIELHACNFRVVIFLWKPFHKCFTSVRRAWDPRSSVTNAFATFLLLSSFKVCFISFNVTFKMHLFLQNRSKYGNVLYNDPYVPFHSIYKEFFFIPLLLLYLLMVILPIFILALYPTKLWRRLMSKLPGRVKSALHMFIQCFQGHYKDGTTGTYDYRSVSCLGFAMRSLIGVILLSPYANVGLSNNGPITAIAFLLIALSLFYAHVQPCKRQYMNVIESLLYCTAGLLLIAIIHNNTFPLHNFILAVILMPSIIFVAIAVYKVLDVCGIANMIKMAYFSYRGRASCKSTSDNEEVEPHRLTHPTQYTPLLTK